MTRSGSGPLFAVDLSGVPKPKRRALRLMEPRSFLGGSVQMRPSLSELPGKTRF
jgi:hypothetical protein